jgi:hypothetical protein
MQSFIERFYPSLKQEAAHLRGITTVSKQNGSSMNGSSSTILTALTPTLIKARQTPHALPKRRYEKRHEHQPDTT